MTTTTIKRWDIFCRVIDNFGDIGVCWRLARQLVAEYGVQVRLWVDDVAPLQALDPDADMHSVEVQVWSADFPQVTPADVVIEAFACDLPASYLAAMQQRQPVWINLEYLTAEPWVADFHRKPSHHPPLTKYFFFPGFTPQTGGLLREPEMASNILDLPPRRTDELRISLFAYENLGLATLLNAWAASATPITCFIPKSKIVVR
jgi:uncharacterized repeat protein (TIGR03837 family)